MVSASTQDGSTIAVMAPKDAEGRKVPLDTKLLYSDKGIEYEVDGFTFRSGAAARDAEWLVEGFGPEPENMIYSLPLDSMYLEKPDSWEKLEEDLDRCIKESDLCWYYNPSGQCNDCTISGNESRGCTSIVLEDIKKRIRKLRGDE